MKVEDYYYQEWIKIYLLNENRIDLEDAFKLARDYHKSQVESIADEEINAKYPIMGGFNNAMWDLKQSSLRQGEKNFKQTLLNKIK